jgi:hypothetical protein
MKIRRERVSAAPAQACSPQRSSRVDRDSPAVGAQCQRNFQLPGRGLLARSNFRFVASLDRKRLEADFWGGAGCRTEAFSIRRLGGSRWRLRRTRCAMGFECQSGIESRDGGLAENSESGVEMVAAPWKRRNRKPTKKAVSVRRGHECVGVREHILASRLRDGLGRIEVHAC